MTYKLERLARVDGATDNASLQNVSLAVVADQAARQLREMAEARGVRFSIAADMPEMIVDVGRLELTLVNLLSNAIKYCDPAKPDSFVAVDARALDTGDCEICVRDNGIGIPANKISLIFRRFTRAHSDRSDLDAVTGVGLGLAIVDDCVIAMNGTIAVDSTEGEVTTFRITLPATPVTVATPSDLLKPMAGSVVPSLRA